MTTTARPAGGLSEAQVFGLRFFAFLLLASALAWVVKLPARLTGVQHALAASAHFLAGLVGSTSPLHGDQIFVQTLTIDVNFECTGVYVLLILLTFLFAYPAPWPTRITGALLGAVGLTVVNVLRIAFLIRIAELAPDLFDYFHEYVWQGVFLVLVIVYAMSWVERLRVAEA